MDVDGLQKRMQLLEDNMQLQSTQQQQHNHEVAVPIQQLNAKVDSQTTNIQRHMDAKLHEQLANIEQLLTNKQRRTADKE